ncbi:MAG: PLP-dependent aspartate aminotransferase family protein [Elusimicrobiota bacterium]|jgi:cystathionine beta-lyase|nr:PLP-dependent aspartate aminotransferase family protein [Elusimicrobiota bacterium]
MKRYKKQETAFIHGGIYGDDKTGAVNVPIYQTATYQYEAPGRFGGYEYSRTGNPTRAALEVLAAELENGTDGFAFASGMAAVTAVLSLFKAGDKILISSNVYGGTFRVLEDIFKNFDIGYILADTEDLTALERVITPDTKAVFFETPTNPLMRIADLKGIASLAKKHKLLSIVDNTFMTPYLQRPLDFGIDIVIHSATKYLGGHSDIIAGLVVVNSKELGEKVRFIQNSAGAILQPFDCFLLLRGIKTLGVRMDRHVKNAQVVSDFLRSNRAVKKVYYPGFKDSAGYHVNAAQAKNGGAMTAFELKEGFSVNKFFSALKMIVLGESLGGVESLICHPATMTHAAMPEHIRKLAGITENMVRFSPGIEDVDDILEDIGFALKASKR